jgi:hypothetical protein
MATPYEANIVQLSSGYVTFNDPTKLWTPDDFPNLPSTSLGLTTRGRIEDGTFSTMRLTNAITYEPFEPTSVYSILKKSFLIADNGDVTLEEAKMGFISTVSAPFDANVTEFTPSIIGGANIFDVVSGDPDTVTNAIAKLDAWINNAFLQQPPAVQVVDTENTSLFAGTRWQNFNTYSVMDRFVPFVTSMVFIIGDPTTSDYLTFEIHNCKYFPYKIYRDGVSPEGAPLVRLRVFDEDYGVATGDLVCKKSQLTGNDITIISESGNLTLPAIGPVMAFSDTNGFDTYTTLSLYIPNIQNTYPLDTSIPVRVIYLNRTEGQINTMSTLITQTSFGAPSAPQQVSQQTLYSNAVQVVVERPVYSDTIGGVTDPFFSTYTTKFTYAQLATAHAGNIGFQYGVPTPTTLPSSMSTFTTTYSQNDEYTASIQTVSSFINPPQFYRGTVWSTSVAVTNLAELVGVESAGLYTSTLFGNHGAINISSANLHAINPFVAQPYTRNIPTYTPGSGWSTGAPLDHALAFVSSPSYLTTTLSTSVQFNDPSYPGDRSTMTVKTYFVGTNSNADLTDTLLLSTINERFILNSVQSSELIATLIQDTQSTIGYTDFFYKANHAYHTLVSTVIGPNTQESFLTFTNSSNTGFNGPIVQQTYSTPNFVFETTSSLQYNTTNLVYTNTVTSTTVISGLYTPTQHSHIYIDLQGSNFAEYYANSNFACAEIYISSMGIQITPRVCISTNQIILNAGSLTEITSTPFPVDTLLTLSSVKLSVNEFTYTDPLYTMPLNIVGKIASTNPEHTEMLFESTFSTLYVDTYSCRTYTNFASTTGTYGKRVLSLLPRLENPGTPTNMNDGITFNGNYGIGLNVAISSFIFMSSSQIAVSSLVNYVHASSLNAISTDSYSRELLYTYGRYIHPAGYNFTPFSGTALGNPTANYPDFTYDMYYDENKGNRFASFMFEEPAFDSPTPLQYMMVAIHNPSYISTITATRDNNFFPTVPVVPYLVSSMRVHVHAKVVGEYDVGTLQTVETAWVNCFKQIDELTFNDSTYDVGGCSAVHAPSIGSNAGYMYAYVHFNRRFYTKIGAIVRVGISYDASVYSGDPLTFDAVSVSFSD